MFVLCASIQRMSWLILPQWVLNAGVFLKVFALGPTILIALAIILYKGSCGVMGAVSLLIQVKESGLVESESKFMFLDLKGKVFLSTACP